MSKLFLLNILLLAGITMASIRLMDLRDETAKREQLVRDGAPKLPQAKPVQPAPVPERTVASNYLDIAARLLFSKDRNPAVIIAPPPVKQIPPFPLTYGVLMLAQPPVIMMAAGKGAPQRGYRPGDTIGDFKIVNFDSRSIEFEWDGQKFTKWVAELADRDAKTQQVMAQNAPPEAAAAAAAPPAGTSGVQVLTQQPTADPKGPGGVDMGGNMRSCVAGDDAPAGTVRDGYKKIESATPFGRVCRWEKVN